MRLKSNQRREIAGLVIKTSYSNRKIAKLKDTTHATVAHLRRKVVNSGLAVEELQELDDLQLEARLSGVPSGRDHSKIMPDWKSLHKRLRKNKHLTLQVLWEEYRAIYKERAYCYAQFTHYYRKYLVTIDLAMRLNRYPGEAMFVDYAGTLIPYTVIETGEEKKAQVFIAVLGWSSYTFVHASRSQRIEDFTESHNQAVLYFGGSPEAWVPDNLKAAVIKAGQNLILNRTYQEMSAYYGSVVVPARARKPKDKALAEQAVLHVSRWITARLLERKFFSVDEINQAILELLPELNERPMREYDGSRRSRFEETEKAALKPLPAQRFEFAEWVSRQKVGRDYHVKVLGHWYSVPYRLVAEYVEARVSHKVVELFHRSRRIATHIRYFGAAGGFTTDPQHMPAHHLAYAEQGQDSFVSWAQCIGPNVVSLVRSQYDGKRNQSMVANKACSNLKALARLYEPADFEAACKRAIEIASPTVKSVKSILKTGLYKLGADQEVIPQSLPEHGNVRGAQYYQQGGR